MLSETIWPKLNSILQQLQIFGQMTHFMVNYDKMKMEPKFLPQLICYA